MDCPRCRQRLRPDPELWACPDGHGRFADGDTMQDFFRRTGRRLRKLPDAGAGVTCPGCGTHTRCVEQSSHHVDVCPQCTGVWLDAGEDILKVRTPGGVVTETLRGLWWI